MAASAVEKLIGILIFDEVELLDFSGPIDAFAQVRLDESRRQETRSPFRTVLIAENNGYVPTVGGMQVMKDYALGEEPQLDELMLPGGPGVRRQLDHQPVLDWVRSVAPTVELVTSTCTGGLLLAAAGLADGHRVTTHWRSLEWLALSHPAAVVVTDQRVVQDGRLITSAGVTASIDCTLAIVKHYYGEAIAIATADELEYPYGTNTRAPNRPGPNALQA
jgi:transcriptional regulator GlxA family with amidase domain